MPRLFQCAIVLSPDQNGDVLRILITNDDGIDALALPILAKCLAHAGHDVLVAAPLEGYSGCGASIGQVTEGQFVALTQVLLAGAEEIPAFSVASPPAFIVLAAVQGMFGEPPDVVITGPNSGLNLGPLVIHSGTLGAAVTAVSNGLPAIALSTEKGARFGFTTAAQFCALNLEALLNSVGKGSALNINVPDLPLDQVAGVRITQFAPRSLVAIILSEDVSQPEANTGKRQMCVSLKHDHDHSLHRKWRAKIGQRDNSDAGAIVDGCISVTAVHGGLHHVDLEGCEVGVAWQGTQ